MDIPRSTVLVLVTVLTASFAFARQNVASEGRSTASTPSRRHSGGSHLIPELLEPWHRYDELAAEARKAEAKGDDDVAEQFYREAIASLDHDFSFNHLPLALLYDKEGQDGKARVEYAIVVHGEKGSWPSTEDDPVVLTRYGDLCRAQGLLAEAARAYATGARQSHQAEGGSAPSSAPRTSSLDSLACASHTAAAIARGSHGDFDGRTRELAVAVRLDPNDWVPRYYRAFDFQDRGRGVEAVREAALAERLAPPWGRTMVRAMRRFSRIPDPQGHLIDLAGPVPG